MSRRKPGVARAPAPRTPPARRRPDPPTPLPVVLGVLGGGLALLAWTTRHALPGTPVADDYDFLARVRLVPHLDLFDGGGFPFYWRPLTRQLYYATLGSVMLAAPWIVACLHGLVLFTLAFLLHRIARRHLPPVAALCFALLPLVAESARLLLVWPACAQPLFGTTLAAAAVAAALAGQSWLAGIALLAGLLSYEQAAWALPVIVAALSRATGTKRERIQRLVPVAIALVAWIAGLGMARMHGVRWPVGDVRPDPATAHGMIGTVVANVDLVPAPNAALLLGAQLVVIGAAFAWSYLARHDAPKDGRGSMPPPAVLAGCAGLGLLGLAPALAAPELWAPRHAFLPSLLLGYAAIAACARAGPVFAPALLFVRVVALLLAPVGGTIVGEHPVGGSRTSFPELVRLQRIVDSAHRVFAKLTEPSTGASYWAIPMRSTIAFAEAKALQVWTGDPKYEWGWLERPERSAKQVGRPVLCFDINVSDPARIVDPVVVDIFFTAMADGNADVSKFGLIDSLLEDASRRNGPRPGPVIDEMDRTRAVLAAIRGHVPLAESLMTASLARYGTKPDHLAIAGWIALQRGRLAEARRLANASLASRPDLQTGRALLMALNARERRQK